MRKQRIGWVLLGIAVLFCVGLAMLACLPAWDGSSADCALDAIFDLIRTAGSAR